MAKCVVCGSTVRWQQHVCADCEEKYGKPYPEWLQFLVNDEERQRRADKRDRGRIVPFNDEIDYKQCSSLPSFRGLDAAFDECEEMGVDWEATDWCE